MYAVIETGGKQYRVQPGDVIQVEKLDGELGKSLKFDQILFVSKPNGETSQIWIGKPYLSGASVTTEIVGQGRGKKVLIVKMKRRKQYRRTKGHRQELTQLLVTSLDSGAGDRIELSAEDKKTKITKFQSHLKPRGSRKKITVKAATPKTTAKSTTKSSKASAKA